MKALKCTNCDGIDTIRMVREQPCFPVIDDNGEWTGFEVDDLNCGEVVEVRCESCDAFDRDTERGTSPLVIADVVDVDVDV